jgi:hypothetical protein
MSFEIFVCALCVIGIILFFKAVSMMADVSSGTWQPFIGTQ